MARRLPGVRRVGAYLDLGALGPGVMSVVGTRLPYEQHPWEKEAYLLATGRF